MASIKDSKLIKKHPILFNLAIIVLCALAIGYVSMFLIDIFTMHGQSKEVPDVKSLNINEAAEILEKAGFKWEISDSTYKEGFRPGAVIEQDPKAHSSVKSLRTIYLTINAISPREITIPQIRELSYRQGRSMLEGLGFRNIKVEYASSPYKELILDISANGRQIEAGTKLPVTAKITIIIGDGMEACPADSFEVSDSSQMLSDEELEQE